jgi:hypothetical protein
MVPFTPVTMIVYMPSLSLQRDRLCSYVAKLATPHHTSYCVEFHPTHHNRYKLNIQVFNPVGIHLHHLLLHLDIYLQQTISNGLLRLLPSHIIQPPRNLWFDRHMKGKTSALICYQYSLELLSSYIDYMIFFSAVALVVSSSPHTMQTLYGYMTDYPFIKILQQLSHFQKVGKLSITVYLATWVCTAIRPPDFNGSYY